ncbi:disease resistance protein RPM1-like [Lolium rigidum]|uniref:disease resistance protein RPM1-like n=1 Tax=Lolium rigidum TaxID=89674 RepID=UPI001F5C6898|nr:disease resistance protein RPM1-like [Lolium rigidum]
MEVMALSMAKAVFNGVLTYAKNGVLSYAEANKAEEIRIQSDVDFITEELQMMQLFLVTADEDNCQNNVMSTTCLKQIRNLAYKAEDKLMDFGLHSEKKPFWGFIPRSLSDPHRIATELNELRAKMEDVSRKNPRYGLFKSNNVSSASRSTAASTEMFGINEAILATLEQKKSYVLQQLITMVEEDLRVIAMWGTSGDHGKMSAIQEVYDDPEVLKKFGFRAWVRLMNPFNPQEFLRSLVRQFYENSHEEVGKQESETSVGANIFAKMEKMDQSDLICVFNTKLCSNSYLIVINDLSTIEDWHCVKKYFPNNKKQSRIIVSTQNGEIASLCTDNPCQVTELKQLSCDQTLYLFHKKDVHASMPTSNIQQEDEEPNTAGENISTASKKFNRSRTLALVDGVLTGREKEKSTVIKLIGQPDNKQSCKVISVWGMSGLGKTSLVRSVYGSQELAVWKHAWVTALRPFSPEVLLRDLALQLQKSIQEDISGAISTKGVALMKIQELKVELARLLKTQNYLVVLDDISSNYEWDLLKEFLDDAGRIIITTRERNIAKYCSRVHENMYGLQGLQDDAALDLFTKKVFKDNTHKFDCVPAMMDQASIMLKKCDGLPLAISTIGGFLATKPKTVIEWRRMNDRVNAALQINPELRTIKAVLMMSYDGLPYYLKSPFLYLAIFQEDQKIRLDRLVRRWMAEGYSRDMDDITAEQLGRRYFEEVLDRSMTLPVEDVNNRSGKIDSCQLHDIIRELCISKARVENLVFTLEDGCSLVSTQGPIRHLVIGSNWKRDVDALPSVLDLSQVRSLTVFGEWRPFFISGNMRFVRVLDLEDTLGLRDHHLDRVGKLHHLKFLSLRGCWNIFRLPNSLGNLWHLQTLDVRGTRIFDLPTAITNLSKLQNLRAPDYLGGSNNLIDSKYGAKVPRGIGQLRALHKLGGAYVEENATVKELRELTELRKLGVAGISSKNSMEFWSAIGGHDHLRSLSVRGKSRKDDLDGCPGERLSPPSWLESLKLYGRLVRVTDWIHQLQNLCKLVLEHSCLEQDGVIRALGMLPNLAVLRLKVSSFWGKQLHFQNSDFPSLVVLELYYLPNLESVLFEEDAMPSLELLQIGTCSELNKISGLSVLTSLKEIRLGSFLDESLKPEMLRQLGQRQKHVIVKDSSIFSGRVVVVLRVPGDQVTPPATIPPVPSRTSLAPSPAPAVDPSLLLPARHRWTGPPDQPPPPPPGRASALWRSDGRPSALCRSNSPLWSPHCVLWALVPVAAHA